MPGSDIEKVLPEYPRHTPTRKAKFSLENLSLGIKEPPRDASDDSGEFTQVPAADADADVSSADDKPLCPCCHTHSRLVLERTLHDGFTSTVLCCSRHAIEPSSPSVPVWSSPSCMCSPDTRSVEEGVDPRLPLPDATLEFSGCQEPEDVSTPSKSGGVTCSISTACSEGHDTKTQEPKQCNKTMESLNIGRPSSDEKEGVATRSNMQFTRKPAKPGVAYMRLSSNEAQYKAEEQQRRASRQFKTNRSRKRDVWRSAAPIRDVVIKIIHKDLMEEDAMQKAYDEVQLLEGLDHPNLMPLLSSVNTDKELWLFFEHAELDDLYKFTKYQTLTEGDLREVCRQLLPALEYIHKNGVVHGDVKPQNVLLSLRHDVSDEVHARLRSASDEPTFKIPPSPAELIQAKKAARGSSCRSERYNSGKCLCSSAWHESCLDRDGRCSETAPNESGESRSVPFRPTIKDVLIRDLRLRICDFGMAQRLNQDGFIQWTCVRGTHGYMAPEILNRDNFDEKIDMWAFGSMMCRMATGQEPFYPASSCRKIDYSFHPCLWQERSDGIKEFVANLLSRDPQSRMSASEAKAHPWVLEGDA